MSYMHLCLQKKNNLKNNNLKNNNLKNNNLKNNKKIKPQFLPFKNQKNKVIYEYLFKQFILAKSKKQILLITLHKERKNF